MKIHLTKTLISSILITILSLSDSSAIAAFARRDFDSASQRTPSNAIAAKTGSSESVEETKARIAESFVKSPLSFEANRGQVDGKVKFLSRGGGYTLFLTSDEAVWVSKRSESVNESRDKLTRLEKSETSVATRETVLR